MLYLYFTICLLAFTRAYDAAPIEMHKLGSYTDRVVKIGQSSETRTFLNETAYNHISYIKWPITQIGPKVEISLFPTFMKTSLKNMKSHTVIKFLSDCLPATANQKKKMF